MPLTTEERSFKYDVAFSFLKEDLTLAQEINDVLQDRTSTFIFTERQDELVGHEGMARFREVFGKQARVVVVLYREAWGTTPWTRVEEDAIRDRSNVEGPDFTVFISLDKTKPMWLSRTQLWYDLDAFGVKGTAAVISKKVAEYGGTVREETVEDRVARNRRELEYTKWFTKYYASKEAETDAWDEFRTMRSRFAETMKAINSSGLGYSFGMYDFHEHTLMYHCADRTLWIAWNHRYADTLVGSTLDVAIENGTRFDSSRSPNDRIMTYARATYTFLLTRTKERHWQDTNDVASMYTSEQLLNRWIKPFLDEVHVIKLKEQQERIRAH